MIKRFFKWVFKVELENLDKAIKKANNQARLLKERTDKVDILLGTIDISVDVHRYSPSWAVISIQGQNSDYIKFIDLGQRDIREIQQFLSRYDRGKVDAAPQERRFLRVSKKYT